MKLYNIYNEVILEAVTNFKTWVSGSNNIRKNITDMLDVDSGGKYYYCNMIYPNKEGIDQTRWVIITEYGVSKLNNEIIRVLEINNGNDEEHGFKTYEINKIKRMSVSKVPVYDIPEQHKADFNKKGTDLPDNPFKTIKMTADFGSYQYAASTLKNKERAAAKAAKAAELEKQTTQQPAAEPVEPAQTTTQQKTVEPQVPQQQNKPVVEPQVQQQQEPEMVEPEVKEPEVEPNSYEEEINNLLNNNKIKKRNG